MEMHFVHADADMNLAVIGVFLEEVDENDELEKIFEHLPHAAGHDAAAEAAVAKITANYKKLLPKKLDAFIYSGSLTTPPCSEGVAWHVLKKSVELSSAQIDAYRELFQEQGNRYDTTRPVQPLNGRVIGEVVL